MDRQTLKQIIFQSKQSNKQQYRSSYKRSQLIYLKNDLTASSKLGSICLLGSLQMHQKHMIPMQKPTLNKFQIVQLKKYRTKTPKKQSNKYDNALKSQLKNRQIRSHRDSFKVDRIQHSQLGMFQKSLGVKFIQKPIYCIQGQIIANKINNQSKKSQILSRMEHGTSSLNIESLPQKFIPSEILSAKQYKRIYEEQRRKIIEQTNQSIKKNLHLDFKTANLNLIDNKRQLNNKIIPQKQKQAFTSDQSNNSQIFLRDSNSQQYKNNSSYINRASSMTGVPKKNLLKKIYQQHKQFQQKIQKQKKQALQIRKQVAKNYAKPFNPPQNISAQAYIVYEITKKQSRYRKIFQMNNGQRRRYINSHKILVEYNSRSPVQIASLTKIMTFCLALDICERFTKEPNKELIKIGFFQTNITGTTANLEKGEIYTLEQLFYGLMLPSGNDASIAIAVWGGKNILENEQNKDHELQCSFIKKKKIFYDKFLEQMNKKAIQLGMEKTNYANSHGLMNYDNKSCAFDLALLCEHAMKNQIFKQVVKTKFYECFVSCEKQDCQTVASPTLTNRSLINIQNQQILQMKDFYANQKEQQYLISLEQGKNFQTPESQIQQTSYLKQNKFVKKVIWQNTHMLVQDKPNLYKGIKTGITNAAGPCLSSMFQVNKRQFIVIVLNCKNMKHRFRDTQTLRKWTFEKEQITFNE